MIVLGFLQDSRKLFQVQFHPAISRQRWKVILSSSAVAGCMEAQGEGRSYHNCSHCYFFHICPRGSQPTEVRGRNGFSHFPSEHHHTDCWSGGGLGLPVRLLGNVRAEQAERVFTDWWKFWRKKSSKYTSSSLQAPKTPAQPQPRPTPHGPPPPQRRRSLGAYHRPAPSPAHRRYLPRRLAPARHLTAGRGRARGEPAPAGAARRRGRKCAAGARGRRRRPNESAGGGGGGG